MTASMTNRILRRPDVEAMTGLARSTLYRFMDSGHFPRPVSLGLRAVGWRESDIVAWMESRASTKPDSWDASRSVRT